VNRLETNFSTTSDKGNQKILIEVPGNFKFQIVFRQSRTDLFEIQELSGLKFHFIDNIEKAMSAWRIIRTIQSQSSALKTIAKISSGRSYYFVTEGDEIIHTGWITSSSCRYYNVKKGDIVIGPIWSSESTRSRGIGAWGTKIAMNKMMEKGSTVFYIDTSNNNIPCLKLIERCWFGAPVATYLRWDLE
jgi:hypothetical protein